MQDNRQEFAAPELRDAADAGDAEALFELASMEFRAGRYLEAARRWQQLCEQSPDQPQPLVGLGAALQRIGRLDEASECYQRALVLESDNVDAHCNLGSVYQAMGELNLALSSYRAALRVRPGQPFAIAGTAAVLDWQGKYQEAIDIVEPLIRQSIDDPELTLIYARLLRRVKRQDEAAEFLRAALASDLHPAYRQRMKFVLGDLLDDLQQFDEAFEAYRQGNALKQAQFDPATHRARTDKLIEFFSTRQFAQLARSKVPSEQAVFIVGMPRTGTSLVEQILAAHSQVYAAGELGFIENMARGLNQFLNVAEPYPDCLVAASDDALAALASDYLRLSKVQTSNAIRVTDKMPTNFLHLGLIQLLFPGARVIHCRRNSLDTSLSCYFQNFGGGGMPFAYDLEHIASYYNDYKRLMAHYKEVLTLPILDIDYETLVSETESSSRNIIEFVGLDWEPACLNFHQLKRTAITASHAQVRQPVYTRSVGRYQHYKSHIKQLAKWLGQEV